MKTRIGTMLENNIVAVLAGLAVLGALLAWLGMGQGAALIAMIWGSILMWWSGAGKRAVVTDTDDESA